MADEPIPFEKISIHGPALAALLHSSASSSGDSHGLLFGRTVLLPPLDPSDDLSSAPSSSSPAVAAVVTSHLSSSSPASFFDPLGRIDPHSPLLRSTAAAGTQLLGWFSARRLSSLRSSMRERAVSLSLSKTLTLNQESSDLHLRPSVFLLLSSAPSPNHAVHTHEYRAFVIRPGGAMEPRSVTIINVGPAFRGQYGAFAPESPLPLMPCALRGSDEREGERRSIHGLRQLAREQRLLEASVEGFGIERLGRLVGNGAVEYTSEVEDLYKKMLAKLEGLARQVEESNARVFEQETRNLELRKKLAGLE